MLPKIPNLESVILRFDKNATLDDDYPEAPQSVDYRETIIQWLGTGLVSLERPLKELGIQNQQNVTPLSNVFQQVLRTLSSLRLNVVHSSDSACPENEIEVCTYSGLSTGPTYICLGFGSIPYTNLVQYLIERGSG
jgi:hypothetical protein